MPTLYTNDLAACLFSLTYEVYGAIHSREFFSRGGARESDDARRIGRIEALGWEVLVIDYRALSQERWVTTVERVVAFLEAGRGRWLAPAPDENGMRRGISESERRYGDAGER